MIRHLRLLTPCLVGFTLLSLSAHATAPFTFEAALLRENVLPTPNGPTPANVHGRATFELEEPSLNVFELTYEIELVNIDTAAYRAGATGADTPSITTDDLAAIHVHFVEFGSLQNKGTPHVFNPLGPPLSAGIGLVEDDLQLVSFDPNTLTTVFSGRWDAADVVQTAGLPEGPRTKPIGDYLEELSGKELFMMVHTSGNSDGAIGGTLLVVPEPAALQLLAACLLLSSRYRSCGRVSLEKHRWQ